MAARWPLATDYIRVAADTGVRLVICVLRFCAHLGKDCQIAAALFAQHWRSADVTGRAGRNRNIRLRDVERLHLREIDVARRAAYVVIRSFVAKLD